MDLSKWDWGSVPAWFGALSLILAFTIFLRDRVNANRAQIDLVGAWTTVEYERSFHDKPPVVAGTVTAHLRNASQLPVRIAQACYKIESRWFVPDLDQPQSSHTEPWVWTETAGTAQPLRFHTDVLVAPQMTEEISFGVDVQDSAPERAEHLALTNGIKAGIEWLLVIDNAGRRWVARPERGGRAKRVRWWWRPKEHMLRAW